VQAQLDELRREVAELRARRRTQARWAVVTVLVASAAWASTRTDGLWVFDPDAPAQASEVNDNFSQVRTWLRNKVGTDLNSGNVAVPGNLSVGGSVSFGNLSVGTLAVTGSVGSLPVNGNITVNGSQTVSGNLSVGGTTTLGVQQKVCSGAQVCTCDGGRVLLGGGVQCSSGSVTGSFPIYQAINLGLGGTIPAQSWLGSCSASLGGTFAICARVN
jgi:hypothetical protein